MAVHGSTSSNPIMLALSGSWSHLDKEDSDDNEHPSSMGVSTNKVWLKEFNYHDGEDKLEAGQSVVSWWGVCIDHILFLIELILFF
jgi:hypothetical protein